MDSGAIRKVLYIIENEKGMVKIGVTSNIKRRIHTITTASGIPIIKIKTIECEDPLTEEKRLLEKYKDYRVYGEWL